VYLDLDFFQELATRFHSDSDFARAYVIAHEVGHHVQDQLGIMEAEQQAYVIAHEVGHHVQHLLGISDRVDQQRARGSQAQGNAMSVRLELQADCFAGVWAHHSQRGKGWLEAGDIEEGLNAASQIGDDTLQRRSRGTVVPESFTHGSSAQRVQWFKRGLQSGVPAQCNTFETAGS
jgi:predicted metalloprotease